MTERNDIRVPFGELVSVLERALLSRRLDPERAAASARLIAETDLDGVYSHGISRFPRLLHYIDGGLVEPEALPEREWSSGAIERWNGNLGPGNLNAAAATDRAVGLARAHGMGCVAMRNTSHWMRGGTYGWRAAAGGACLVAWTNTVPNMPPWGAATALFGNNPLVMAVPDPLGGSAHIVLDMAMTQFAYGKLDQAIRSGRKLPFPGGFDERGELTVDPEAIKRTRRALPIGLWKGSGLSFLLDALGAMLSGGDTTPTIGERPGEYGVTQVFLAFDVSAAPRISATQAEISSCIARLHSLEPANGPGEGKGSARPSYPGERTLRAREENLRLGVPVNEGIWNFLNAM